MWYNPHVPFSFGKLAPDSSVVKSDQEYLQPYQANVDFFRSQMQNLPTRSDLAFQYAEDAQKFARDNGLGLQGSFYGQLVDELRNPNKAGQPGAGLSTMGRLGFDDGSDILNWDYNAEYDKLGQKLQTHTDKFNAAFDERADNVARQTQAYGQMQGGNFFGGMMNAGYSEPWGNQVMGANSFNQQTETTGGLGGLGGMRTNVQPEFASYNATWNPQARQYRAGSWNDGW